MKSLFEKFKNKCKNKNKVQIKLSNFETFTTDMPNRTIFFALNRIFFPANEDATLRTKQPRFQGLKDREYHVANFATFVS